MPQRLWSALAVVVLAVVVSVDVHPDAVEMLKAESLEAWISNVYYTCVNGKSFAIVRSGAPEDLENYTAVDTGEMKIYVPNAGVFSGDIAKVVVFPRRNGQKNVGVGDRLE